MYKGLKTCLDIFVVLLAIFLTVMKNKQEFSVSLSENQKEGK